MTSWRAETDRWRKAHDKVERELQGNRDVLDGVRAYLRKKGLMEDFLEFLLAAKIGEEEAAKLMRGEREEREQRVQL